MPEYLPRVRGGRPPSPELVEEMRTTTRPSAAARRSPTSRAPRRGAGPRARRHARLRGDAQLAPASSRTCWRQAAADGVRDLVAMPLAPQYSTLSVAKYATPSRPARPAEIEVRFVESWHDHPRLLEAFAEKVREALGRRALDASSSPRTACPCAWSSRAIPIADARGGHRRAAWPARRRQATTRWPTRARAAPRSRGWDRRSRRCWAAPPQGARRVLIVPVGFVCDHTEILFDIDVQAAQAARGLGIALARTESLNTSPTFIRALADLVRPGCLSSARAEIVVVGGGISGLAAAPSLQQGGRDVLLLEVVVALRRRHSHRRRRRVRHRGGPRFDPGPEAGRSRPLPRARPRGPADPDQSRDAHGLRPARRTSPPAARRA